MEAHIGVGREFHWLDHEKVVVQEITVNAEDEVFIKSYGSRSGMAWNSLDVFRESTTPTGPDWKDHPNRVGVYPHGV